jgi:hypothetical protein
MTAPANKKSSKKPARPKGGELFSTLALAELIGSYPQAVKKILKGIEPAVNKPKLKQYRLTQKNSQGKTVKELLDEIEDPKLAEAKTRSAVADAELREIKVQKARRDLVPYADVREELQRVINHLHQRLVIQQPRDIVAKLRKCKNAGEMSALLKTETARVFHDLRTNYKRIFGST